MKQVKEFKSSRPLNWFQAFVLMLIGMKLGNIGQVADWSWWQVLLPIIAAYGLALSLLVTMIVYKAFHDVAETDTVA